MLQPQAPEVMEEEMSFSEPMIQPSRETNGDLKGKQSEGVSEEQNHPSKSPRSSDKTITEQQERRRRFQETQE
ncbi:unnamed protein product [Brassica rapa subsp. narinosa]|uniref:(rape) hypothetical protein n=1 Tax=Brassica napus TaxID=3708 RepID=A0A816Y847_BRANA|nr:unnamed protein product [Brassica napus]